MTDIPESPKVKDQPEKGSNLGEPDKAASSGEAKPGKKKSGWLGVGLGILATVVFGTWAIIVIPNDRLSYLVKSDDIKIFNSTTEAPGIVMLDSLGNRIDRDVYATEVLFWNSGDTILRDGLFIRNPKIEVSQPERLLGLTVVREDLETQGAFRIERDSGGYQIKWANLHPGAYIQLRLTYTKEFESQELPFSVSGNSRVVEFSRRVDVSAARDWLILVLNSIKLALIAFASAWLSGLIKTRNRDSFISGILQSGKRSYIFFVALGIIFVLESSKSIIELYIFFNQPSLPY